MPHIVTDKCQRCRFTDCVTTCPVAFFHGALSKMPLMPAIFPLSSNQAEAALASLGRTLEIKVA